MWFAVQTRSNYESRVHTWLGQEGISDLYPYYTRKVRWSDREKLIERPIFPGYVFVDIADVLDRVRILRVPGICAILGAGRSLFSIPDFEIQQIRVLMSSPESLSQAIEGLYQAAVGDLVEITCGPMCGLRGRVERAKKERILVRIDSMRASVPVQIHAHSVRLVREEPKAGAKTGIHEPGPVIAAPRRDRALPMPTALARVP